MDEAHGLALEARGLSVEAAVRLGWRPCAGPGDALWIAIPIIDRGKRVGTKRRTIGEVKLFVQDKGTPQILYNIDCLRDPELAGFPLLITEGEIDCLAAIQCGYPKSVSVPGGAPEHDDGTDSARWAFLRHAKAELAGEKVIVLAVDADRNGKVLQEGLARRLGKGRCQVLEYPTGKDLGDVLASQGPQGVRETIGKAQFLPVTGLLRLDQIVEPPIRRALDTFIPGLERHLRIRRGDLIVVTGPPGHGKSTFVTNLCCNLAWHWRITSAIASMESTIVPDMRRVLRSYRAECLEKDMSHEQVQIADAWINDRFVFLQAGEDEDMTLAWLLERFAVARRRHDATVAVLDPFNEISIADKPEDWTTEQWISQSLRQIKKFARAQDMTMIIVAHPRKLGRDKNGRTLRPVLWDIADSASFANRCDAGIVIFRKDLSFGPSDISVEKSRDHYSIGVPGTVLLNWNPEQSRFVR